jgi:hypothetical protein
MTPGGRREGASTGAFEYANDQVYLWTYKTSSTTLKYYSWSSGSGASNGTSSAGLRYGSYVRCIKARGIQAFPYPAQNVTSTSAEPEAKVLEWAPGTGPEEIWFAYSTSHLFDPTVAPVYTECVDLNNAEFFSTSTQNWYIVSATLADLQPNTTYYYKLYNRNVAGEYGTAHLTFTTAE